MVAQKSHLEKVKSKELNYSNEDLKEANGIFASIFYSEVIENKKSYRKEIFNNFKYEAIKNSVQMFLQNYEIEIFRYTQEYLKRKYPENYGNFPFDQAKLIGWFEEARKQIHKEKEHNLENFPAHTLIPDIFGLKRAIPNAFLRSALFGVIRSGRRQMVKNQKIESMSQYEILFSGERLDQNDLDIWDDITYLAKINNVSDELKLTIYDLCKFMGYTISKTNYEAVKSRLNRLQLGQLEIKYQRKFYVGSLIDDYAMDEKTGKIIIRFNKKLLSIFASNDFSLTDKKIRKELGENQVARWIYNFYETHANPIPLSIEYLKKLLNSNSENKEFNRMINKSLALVKEKNEKNGSVFNYEIKDKFLYINRNKPLTLF